GAVDDGVDVHAARQDDQLAGVGEGAAGSRAAGGHGLRCTYAGAAASDRDRDRGAAGRDVHLAATGHDGAGRGSARGDEQPAAAGDDRAAGGTGGIDVHLAAAGDDGADSRAATDYLKSAAEVEGSAVDSYQPANLQLDAISDGVVAESVTGVDCEETAGVYCR